MIPEIRLPPVAAATTLGRAFEQRASCREFSPAPLTTGELATVLAGARRGAGGWAYPSAHDLRPVEVTVVLADESGRPSYTFDPAANCLHLRNRTLTAPLTSIAYDDQPWLDTAPAVIALEADLDPITEEFEEQDAAGLRGRDFAMIESGALAQNVLLAAAAAGLGAVLVAGIRQQPCRELLGTSRHVCSLIAVGRTPARG